MPQNVRIIPDSEFRGIRRGAAPIYIRENTLDRYVFEEIFIRNQYWIKREDLLKFKTLRNICQKEPGVIFDLGANIGLAAVYFAICYPNSRIYSIEPDRENYDLMLKNIQAYGNITPVLGAVWDRVDSVHISNRDSITTRSGKMNKACYTVENGTKEGEEDIAGCPIGELMRRFGTETIDICKIDIQGTEKRIFQGDTTWLAHTNYLFVEVHDRYVDGCFFAVAEALNRYGFAFIGASGRDGDTLFFAKKDPL